MTNHAQLDNVRHKDLRIRRDFRVGNGYDVNLTRVFPVEFIRLQAEYPLFFIRDSGSGSFEPVALLGFSAGENLFLGDDRWDARYVPLSIERRPFLIGFHERVEDGVPTKVPVVSIDLEDPTVNDREGEPVFLPHGGESAFLERMTSILMTIWQGHEVNRAFSQLLVGLDLVESMRLEVELQDGSKQALEGLYTINEDRLRALNASGLETLHHKGHLKDVYMMLASLSNVASLVEKKDRLLG
ncbi:MAG: SapC family protein [Pseudomonadales bacterium]